MVVVIFRSRMRDDADLAAMAVMGERMVTLATAMPGYLSYKEFEAADGETLTLVEFEDEASLLAWRHQPEHAAGQARARAEFFAEYQITVCAPQRAYRFSTTEGRVELVPGSHHAG